MKKHQLKQKFILFFIIISTSFVLEAQTAWFADGYHGGVFGHYPMWQAKFMVDKLNEHPDWAINLEIEPETWDTVSVKDSKNFKAFQDYYETTGRFGKIEFVNPNYAQPYCYNISGESIIRQFHYGIAKTKEYFPSATFQTYSVEEPCFTSSLPQILKGFGYKYAVLRNPNTCWGGYTSAFGKDLVNWIGPDGTSILAVPRYECEELSNESTWQTNSWTNSNEFIAACLNDGVKYPVGMCFQDAGWDGGPWFSEYKPTQYTTWTEYIEMVKDKVEPTDWEFSLEDVKPGLVWGAQVLQQIAQKVRISENKIVMAEKMGALDYLINNKEWINEDFDEAWRTLMLAQHHDCWIVPYNGPRGDTWADKVERWTTFTNEVADTKMLSLFGDTDKSSKEFIQVYNTLGSSRSEVVEVLLPSNLDAHLKVVDINKKVIPSQISIDPFGNNKLYFEATVPGMGYSTYSINLNDSTFAKKALDNSIEDILNIETDYYHVTFDSTNGGAIISLIDKKNGDKQLVEEGRFLNNLKGFFYDNGVFHQGADKTAKVSIVEDGDFFIKVKVENEIAHQKYSQLITLNKTNPRIDFELFIDWNTQPGIGAYSQYENYDAKERAKAFYNDSYKLHLEFPLKDLDGKLYKNAPFDVCESHLANTLYSSWDNIKHNVILNWVDLQSKRQDYGVALFSDHTTSYIHSDSLALGLTVQYIGKALWGRDYKVHEPTYMRYALLPHEGDWEKGLVQKSSNEWNEPLVAHFTSKSNELPQNSLLEIMDKNLEVSSLTIDDNNLIVRLYNSSSAIGPQRIIWKCGFNKMEEIDLNGKITSEVTFKKDDQGYIVTDISLPQFGFQTFKLSNVNLTN